MQPRSWVLVLLLSWRNLCSPSGSDEQGTSGYIPKVSELHKHVICKHLRLEGANTQWCANKEVHRKKSNIGEWSQPLPLKTSVGRKNVRAGSSCEWQHAPDLSLALLGKVSCCLKSDRVIFSHPAVAFWLGRQEAVEASPATWRIDWELCAVAGGGRVASRCSQ